MSAAAAGLLLTAPLLALISAAVALSSRGPVIFRQRRVGRYGGEFTLFKFRTMRQDAGGLGPQVTAKGDTRITPVGKVLRKTKLDELPELWNIFRGDMSFVGPRPEVPRYVDAADARWGLVLMARPGLTDPVTLRLRNEEELLAGVGADRELFYREVLQPFKLDGYARYLRRRSWRTDLRTIWQTFVAVLLPGSVVPPRLDELTSAAGKGVTGAP